MRNHLVTLGFVALFGAGCSSSNNGDGGTTGTSTAGITTGGTTSGTSATTTGGTTTGASSTGGSTTGSGAGGSACTVGSGCDSNLCLGHLCCTASSCPADPGCAATACDDTGACVYPSGSACGTSACSGSTLTADTCSASGTCDTQAPAPCPGNLLCADALICKPGCIASTDCETGFVCVGGSCITPLAVGAACSQNAACISGVCGLNGTGNCCTVACVTGDATCGATACDDTGACVYPPDTTSCGAASCTNGAIVGKSCNGAGVCAAGTGQPCPGNLGCKDALSCATTCKDNTACASGSFCDLGTTTNCCAALANGSGLKVDNAKGKDTTACCGYGTAGACMTLTRAMQLVTGTNTLTPGTLVTLNASVNGKGGDWATETTPVSLGWGVTLSAPGVYFSDIDYNAEIFDVAVQMGEAVPVNPVTIGVPSVNKGDRVVIGSSSTGTLTTDDITINVEGAEVLDLLNAQVFESPTGPMNVCSGLGPCAVGVYVQATATLNVGVDSKGNTGTAYLGGKFPNGHAPTYTPFSSPGTGVLCNGKVADSAGGTTPSLVSQSEGIGIDAEDGCAVTLVDDPSFGTATAGGYTNAGGGCTTPTLDGTAVLANGNKSTVTLSGATISCMSGYGIQVTNSDLGKVSPVVTVQVDANTNPSLIENCSGAGVYASAGTTYLIATTLTHNFIGVDLETDQSAGTNPDAFWINDGTGTAPGTNSTVVCSSNQENGSTSPGIDVYNDSTATVNADFVNWDHWYDPNGGSNPSATDLFYCDLNFTCSCETLDSSSTAVCVTTAGSDGMDLVLSTGSGTTPLGGSSDNSGASSGNGCP